MGLKRFLQGSTKLTEHGSEKEGTSPVSADQRSGADANTEENRYSRDWNAYSKTWDTRFSDRYAHLGDEWNDDRTRDRKRDEFYFQVYAERFLKPEMTVLEVGPGGGKWSVRLARRVKKLIVLDVAEEMLRRTRQRMEAEGIGNVEYVLASGKDFLPVADSSVDFFFSYDVFVHIALEDTFLYTKEIARVLTDHGCGACHYAVNSVPNAWMRIEHTNEGYRRNPHSSGQYYYFSPDALIRMYEHFGLFTHEYHVEWCVCTLVFEKLPALSHIERLLHALGDEEADDESRRSSITEELERSVTDLKRELTELTREAAKEPSLERRRDHVSTMRRLLRGL